MGSSITDIWMRISLKISINSIIPPIPRTSIHSFSSVSGPSMDTTRWYRAIPATEAERRIVRKLWLSNLHWDELLPQLLECVSLTHLHLYGNGLETLPVELCRRMTKLIYLNLVENRLRTLPSEIGLLTALRCLYLSHNLLETLPMEIGQLARLYNLSVDSNPLPHDDEHRTIKGLQARYKTHVEAVATAVDANVDEQALTRIVLSYL